MLAQCAAELAAVLVDERKLVRRLTSRIGAVEVGERETGHRDHHHRRQGQEDQPRLVAPEQAQVLGDDGEQ
jgi:hypothetical protein